MADDTTLTCTQLAVALDDVLDGHDAAAAAKVDLHLAGCASCRAFAADVRAIRNAARALEPLQPPPAVWAAVHARVGAERPPREAAPLLDRVAAWIAGWGVIQPAAAAAVLVLMVSSLVWVGTRLGERPSQLAGAGAITEFTLAEAEYSDAIASLEQATAEAPGGLDAATIEALRASIDEVDSAIGEARETLAHQPGDEWSQESLLDALGTKVALLQDTVALLGEVDGSAEERNP